MKLILILIVSSVYLASCSLTKPEKETLPPKSNKLVSSNRRNQPVCMKKSSSSNTSPTCSLPFENFNDGFETPGSEIRPDNSILPPWMNLTLAKRGQAFATNYLFSNMLSHGFGLIYTITVPPPFSEILIYTHKSDTPERATFRYFATFTQVLIWYQGDLSCSNDTALTTSLRKVRDIHLHVTQKGNSTLQQGKPLVPDCYYNNLTFNTKLWDAFYKDLECSDIPKEYRNFTPDTRTAINKPIVPINQGLQGLTLWAFTGFPTLFPERFGIPPEVTDDDIFAFNYLWAVLGYGIGIKDEYNVCLQPNITAMKEYYQKIYNTFFLPAIFTSNQNSTKLLAEAILKALEPYTLEYGLTTNTFMYLFLKQIINIPAPNMYAMLSNEEKAVEALIQFRYLPKLASDPEYRANMNKLVDNTLQLLGKKYLGPKYSSMQSRAEEAFDQI